jgi:two-component system sensor histidine kinase DegS
VSVFNGSERYRRLVARWDFWLAIVATAVVTFVYYSDSPAYATMFPQAFRDLGLDRHTLERILYLAPVIWAGFYFSWRGAFVTSLVTLGLMLPRVFLLSNEPLDALVETVSVFVIGNVLALSFASLRKERAYRDELKRAHERQLKTMDELKLAQQNLRFYLQEATRAQEEERKRISHELHDDTIQALVVLSRDLDEEVAGNEALPEEVRTRLEELWHRRIDGIVRGVRRLSQDLRPAALDQLGLIPALEWLGTTLNEHSDIATKVTTTGKERILTEEAAIAVFRICQEALRNVWRHARATEVSITLEFLDGLVRLTVRDNGQGFELPDQLGDLARTAGKLGLTGMQERAQLVGGTVTVHSEPGQGTAIVLEIRDGASGLGDAPAGTVTRHPAKA